MNLEEFKLEQENLIKKPSLAVYQNGNHYVAIFDDGTKIKETIDPTADHFTYEFAENSDIKITDYCDGGCIYCHENSTIKGIHGDLKKIEPMLDTLHEGTEMAVGGGNALAHPDLIWFLEKLKSKGVIANITINQRHLQPYKNLICKLVAEKLVNGIGVSLTDSSNIDDFKFIDTLGENVVIHTIAGILTEKDIECLKHRKVLILGYKDLRRGHTLLEKESESIKKNIEWLKGFLPIMRHICKVISFDCLGIEQINPKKIFNMTDEMYNSLFQGSDTDVTDSEGNITCSTFYIDVPNMTVARMSTAALDQRFKFDGTENVRDLFKISTKGW